MDRAAKLVSLSARNVKLLSYASANIGAILSASGRSVISGRHDAIVFDDDSAERFAQTGASGSNGLGYVKVIIFL